MAFLFYFIVLLIHEIHFCNEITVLKANRITGSFLFPEPKINKYINNKQAKMNINFWGTVQSLKVSS